MIRSSRTFRIAGPSNANVTSKDAIWIATRDNWVLHASARLEIIRSARDVRFRFTTEMPSMPAFIVKPTRSANVWTYQRLRHWTDLEAFDDAWQRSNGYAMGCEPAANFVMNRGALLALATLYPKLIAPKDVLTTDRGVDDWTDWVPGDWGWIKNDIAHPAAGYEGENIIYLGANKWWGFTAQGGQELNLQEWTRVVSTWGKASPQNWRTYPNLGLDIL